MFQVFEALQFLKAGVSNFGLPQVEKDQLFHLIEFLHSQIGNGQSEAGFRENVWQSGAWNAGRKTDEFPESVTAAIIGPLMALPEKGSVSEK
jgi:hypothetical protein